uniref:non-specific serine/threonine protein kinase n=1 Tax=Kalanchoe fedtschenkoi TaxID=63787 RepID=A0A7N0V3X7_KALFE
MEEERKVIFGRYEMGRLLGKGTFAKVYHGKSLATGESVAIKVISKDRVKKEGMMEQIKREISVMKLVKHPNVVDLKEVMATKTKIFFVMEYVKGGELFAKVASGRLKEEVAKGYFQQLISAVDYCHSRGVSHRDLKPENLLLDENGDLKVSDFGLSALPEQVSESDGLLHTRCGTPAYVAPEVLRKKGYGGAEADVWSCGVVLYVLLAGFLPFQDENIMKMYSRIFKAEYEVPPWFSNEAKRVIRKLLVVDSSKRVTIPEIMRMPWFRKGFEPGRGLELEEKIFKFDGAEAAVGVGRFCETTKNPFPAFFNAFELISSMASGFDLSGLFEEEGKKGVAGSMFISRYSASKVVEEMVSLAGRSGLKVGKEKEFKLRIEGISEGRRHGKLVVTAEVFEVAPEVTVVEFSKWAGDALEFNKFLEEDMRLALKNMVWAWQGGGA